MARLAGKVAYITGAGTGIGRCTAELFAREGAGVVIADIDKASGEETAHRIARTGGVAIAIHTDVREPEILTRFNPPGGRTFRPARRGAQQCWRFQSEGRQCR